ncbi:hypothetical protein [Bradyrhizobium sp. Leo121]|uniref:hypothetical protein n=1 Tax=Bradyrhizobium sp. Leo121 TaxID=1571195 RepID=UPI001029009B|nr:hypothetical protein [Bradyrhizobium sp. Leo121]RZN24758.1 hypothetical protein CWO90_28365 [Bradyrhizobium sp. Leo121]
MTVIDRTGGRRIFLLLPFKHEGKWIRSIYLRPMAWDHALKWQDGDYASAMDLLFDIVEQSAEVVRQIRYPDVDRVMNQFFEMLPPDIRDQIAAGQIPQKVVPLQHDPEESTAPDPELEPELPFDEPYDPYRMPTKEEIEADMKAHPVPPELQQPFPPKQSDSQGSGLGFEVN